MNQVGIPEYLNKNLMFSKSVRISPNEQCFDVVITRGPWIYVTKNGQVLSVCDLTATVLKDIECRQSDFSQECSKLYDFDICFSYAGRVKNVFLLLKMRDKFIVMSKRNDQITVHKQFENVRLFKVEEKFCSVHIRVEMMDGISVCEDLYRLTTDDPIFDEERFSGVANTISKRIATAKAELSTTKLDVQKYFHILAKELRFGPQRLHDSVEERVMLAKFGDIWIKRHNDMLVFGVPVYNCCYSSKRLVENVHINLLSDQLNHFNFTYKLFKFEVDETAAPNYDDILNKDDSFVFPSFEQEWQPSENNNLPPDTAAIIVITTSIPDFVGFAVLEFACFVEYEIHDEGRVENLQNFVGKISITGDIFHDAKFLVSFERDNAYKDLLAVTSTSQFVFIKLVFIETATKESFYDFLLNQLEFRKTSESPEDNAKDDDDDDMDKFDFLSTNHVLNHSTDIYFLPKESSYWRNTLIRTHSQGLVDELKIYNQCKGKIASLIQTLKTKFSKVDIQFVDARCDAVKLSVLRHALQKEVQFENHHLRSTSDLVDESYVNQKLNREFETDVACT
ncbi:uncharacterized protein LOC119073700 [Bradysia coprophila]|uniref:uncharacterized protein LOC119073700 n=1 Tax=Bradysia coprophila TaxID=38358 RepID=UPI00187D74DE|nr:uncharacterized protein LOC119073700 [Bradysia coprophila]